jgi:soluble P-type ATPase
MLEHLVMDYNGTLAEDGNLIAGLDKRLDRLSKEVQLHVVTADTHGQVEAAVAHIDCRLHILPLEKQAQEKRDYVRRLGAEKTAAVGNGRNDTLMVAESALGIGVVQAEGAFAGLLSSADVVCTDIAGALDLILQPLRLTATLRA